MGGTTNRLGVLFNQGRYAEAEQLARYITQQSPDNGYAWKALGVLLHLQACTAAAFEPMQKAVALLPDDAEALSNLGAIYRELGYLEKAENCYRRALIINPHYAESCNNLGNTLHEQGHWEEAEHFYRQALQIRPNYREAHSNLLLALNYHNLQKQFDEACRYGRMATAAVGRRRFTAWLCNPLPEHLKIGLVSGDLRNHPVGHFLEGVLTRLWTSLEITVYSTIATADDLSERIRPYVVAWKTLAGLSDEAAACLIHADGIHILLDLAGHTAKNRLPVFAWKPAPIQASWLGYCATTGLEEIDYLLADATGVPSFSQEQFTETIWYLPDTRLCFTAPVSAPAVSVLPALQKGHITFGCFQSLAKIGDHVLQVWSSIMAALPHARLRLQSRQLAEPAVANRLVQRLSQHGIVQERTLLQGSVTRDAYLAAYDEVDIILDTFPYPGGTTTCEALWMGVPTITLAGSSMLARQGASILTAAGLTDWIAENEREYICKAVSLASDLFPLATLRSRLRDKVFTTPLFATAHFARNLEAALWGMWEQRKAALK